MKTATWLLAAACAAAAQPKLLVNAKVDTRSAAAGLEREFRTLVAAQPQPAWIGYSVPAAHGYHLGCDYVRDNPGVAGVVHLEPPDHAVILFRVEAGVVDRVRALSPYCEIDAGDLPVHWLTDVEPAQSVALLDGFAAQRDRMGDGMVAAIAVHADLAADQALDRYLAPGQPQWLRLRVVNWMGSARGRHGLGVLTKLIAADPDQQVRRRAVSALNSVPDGAGIPLLIDLARSGKEPEVRKQAMSTLGGSHDPRALAFFEEVLKR